MRLLSRSLAILARFLRQQMTSNARMGNPMILETIGITTDSGATATEENESGREEGGSVL